MTGGRFKRGYTDERAVSLSQSEGMVMRYLQRDPAAPASRIAAATGLQRTNLSTVLRGLERKGLIERRAQPEDGPGVTVHPTELGRRNYALVRGEWAEAVAVAAGADGGGDGAAGNLDAALDLLRAIEAGLVGGRPRLSGEAESESVD